MSEFDSNRLPRLLVVSDVNVERTISGQLILYRMLQDYPPEKLMVIARPTEQHWAHSVVRVLGADYHDLSYAIPRLTLMRFNPFWPVVMAKYIRYLAPRVMADASGFRPEAVLTVAHDYLCFVADAVADRLRIPLHLIVHDDWTYHQTLRQSAWVKPAVRWACDRVIGPVLRRAANRFCVSPGMVERYRNHYRIESEVLYPCRGSDSAAPAVRVQPTRPNPLVVAYTGSIHHAWLIASLQAMASILAKIGGRLDLYVPYPETQLADWGLAGPNIQRVGFFPTGQMVEKVAATAHILFLPASFQEKEMVDVSTLFPSKLVDYTTIGKPVLVWGPKYSSAVRWVSDNPGAAELITDPNPKALESAIERLADPTYASQLAAGGIAAGFRDFDVNTVRQRFLAAIAIS